MEGEALGEVLVRLRFVTPWLAAMIEQRDAEQKDRTLRNVAVHVFDETMAKLAELSPAALNRVQRGEQAKAGTMRAAKAAECRGCRETGRTARPGRTQRQ